MPRTTRRRFLEDSILATAAAAMAGSTAAEARPIHRQEKSDTLRHAVIGCRIRGRVHAKEFGGQPGCEVAYVCDPDRDLAAELAGAVEKQTGKAPKVVQDLRRIFDDPEVDTVSIAAPNHWHALAAIWAMQAGKDVYVEKPVSHNIWEGRRMVDVARQTGRICAAGTQNRSNQALAAAIEHMRQGGIGKVMVARSIIYGRRGSIGGPGQYEPPANVDYNLWAGPAPLKPLTRPQFHYDWHWFWDTGSGELGNNNIHMVDICRWGLGVTGLGRSVVSVGGRLGYQDAGETPNTQLVVHDFGAAAIVQEVRGLKTEPFNPKFNSGWIFVGTEGYVAGTSLFDREGNLVRTFPGKTENHFANFLKAVRSRKMADLNAPILEGHQSTALCHVGNLSYRLGKPTSPEAIGKQLDASPHGEAAREAYDRMRQHLAENEIDLSKTPLTAGPLLRMETDRERFVDNAAANGLLKREYRAPFVVPGA
jgi:predicted dehydrogenase